MLTSDGQTDRRISSIHRPELFCNQKKQLLMNTQLNERWTPKFVNVASQDVVAILVWEFVVREPWSVSLTFVSLPTSRL